MTAHKFWVVGGVFVDGTFTKLERDGSECYGPFETKREAQAVQSAHIRHNIDICWYNLFVTEKLVD